MSIKVTPEYLLCARPVLGSRVSGSHTALGSLPSQSSGSRGKGAGRTVNRIINKGKQESVPGETSRGGDRVVREASRGAVFDIWVKGV